MVDTVITVAGCIAALAGAVILAAIAAVAAYGAHWLWSWDEYGRRLDR